MRNSLIAAVQTSDLAKVVALITEGENGFFSKHKSVGMFDLWDQASNTTLFHALQAKGMLSQVLSVLHDNANSILSREKPRTDANSFLTHFIGMANSGGKTVVDIALEHKDVNAVFYLMKLAPVYVTHIALSKPAQDFDFNAVRPVLRQSLDNIFDAIFRDFDSNAELLAKIVNIFGHEIPSDANYYLMHLHRSKIDDPTQVGRSIEAKFTDCVKQVFPGYYSYNKDHGWVVVRPLPPLPEASAENTDTTSASSSSSSSSPYTSSVDVTAALSSSSVQTAPDEASVASQSSSSSSANHEQTPEASTEFVSSSSSSSTLQDEPHTAEISLKQEPFAIEAELPPSGGSDAPVTKTQVSDSEIHESTPVSQEHAVTDLSPIPSEDTTSEVPVSNVVPDEDHKRSHASSEEEITISAPVQDPFMDYVDNVVKFINTDHKGVSIISSINKRYDALHVGNKPVVLCLILQAMNDTKVFGPAIENANKSCAKISVHFESPAAFFEKLIGRLQIPDFAEEYQVQLTNKKKFDIFEMALMFKNVPLAKIILDADINAMNGSETKDILSHLAKDILDVLKNKTTIGSSMKSETQSMFEMLNKLTAPSIEFPPIKDMKKAHHYLELIKTQLSPADENVHTVEAILAKFPDLDTCSVASGISGCSAFSTTQLAGTLSESQTGEL